MGSGGVSGFFFTNDHHYFTQASRFSTSWEKEEMEATLRQLRGEAVDVDLAVDVQVGSKFVYNVLFSQHF
jgi:hypothetical protein